MLLSPPRPRTSCVVFGAVSRVGKCGRNPRFRTLFMLFFTGAIWCTFVADKTTSICIWYGTRKLVPDPPKIDSSYRYSSQRVNFCTTENTGSLWEHRAEGASRILFYSLILFLSIWLNQCAWTSLFTCWSHRSAQLILGHMNLVAVDHFFETLAFQPRAPVCP